MIFTEIHKEKNISIYLLSIFTLVYFTFLCLFVYRVRNVFIKEEKKRKKKLFVVQTKFVYFVLRTILIKK